MILKLGLTADEGLGQVYSDIIVGVNGLDFT